MRKKEIDIQKYNQIHYWLKKKYGVAKKCENRSCKKRGKRFEWALRRDCDYEFMRKNFLQLCSECHKDHDGITKLRNMSCEYCCQTFHEKHFGQRFCSQKCNMRARPKKLTNEQVKEIQKLKEVMSHAEIGRKLGVSKSLISFYVNRKPFPTYKSI